MTPQLGGTISSEFFSRYDATVQAGLNSGPNVFVILDVVGSITIGFHEAVSLTWLGSAQLRSLEWSHYQPGRSDE